MEIKHNDNGQKGAFYIELTGKRVGEMTYVWSGPDKIIVDHTEIGEELKGKGAGRLLLERVVQFAREKKIKILPLCPFAAAQFEKTPEYSDVRF